MKYIIALAFIGLSTFAHAQIADVTTDFGTALTNPNGNWSYGYFPTTLGAGFTLFDVRGVSGPTVGWAAPQSSSQLGTPAAVLLGDPPVNGVNTGEFFLHPGPTEISVARFIVPGSWGAGMADVVGRFDAGDSGSVNGYILINGASVFSSNVSSSDVPFSLSNVALTPGDVIDFAVDNDGNFLFDSTPLAATITYSAVPEPASMLAVGLGLAGLARRRKKSA